MDYVKNEEDSSTFKIALKLKRFNGLVNFGLFSINICVFFVELPRDGLNVGSFREISIEFSRVVVSKPCL